MSNDAKAKLDTEVEYEGHTYECEVAYSVSVIEYDSGSRELPPEYRLGDDLEFEITGVAIDGIEVESDDDLCDAVPDAVLEELEVKCYEDAERFL